MRTRRPLTRRTRSVPVILGASLVGVALLIVAAPLRAGSSPAGDAAASPVPIDGSWPSSAMCEPWPAFQEEVEPGAVAPDPRADTLVARLSDPAFSAVVGSGDWLAYLSLADGLWAHGELARGSERFVHRPYESAPWERIDGAEARPSRVPRRNRRWNPGACASWACASDGPKDGSRSSTMSRGTSGCCRPTPAGCR